MSTGETLTGKSHSTIVDWYNMCREVYPLCGLVLQWSAHTWILSKLMKRVLHKYHRGRMLQGDHPAESEDSDEEIQNQRDHGARVDGPWGLGLNQRNDFRYFWVERRDKNTLVPIIQRECAPQSVIHLDEWDAYRCLTSLGYEQNTVNHQSKLR